MIPCGSPIMYHPYNKIQNTKGANQNFPFHLGPVCYTCLSHALENTASQNAGKLFYIRGFYIQPSHHMKRVCCINRVGHYIFYGMVYNSYAFVVYLSNRPQVSMAYRLITHAGCWKNTRRIRKSWAASEWFTNYSCVLPTSQVVYQPIDHRNLWSIAFI